MKIMHRVAFDKKVIVRLIFCLLISFGIAIAFSMYDYCLKNSTLNLVTAVSCMSKKVVLIITISLFVIFFFLSFYTKFLSYLHKYRYLIGAGIVVVLTLFQISGSSISQWLNYINDGTTSGGDIFGISRGIRSDEWATFTPMAFSQEFNNYQYSSELLRGSSTDMFMVYGQPVWDIAMVFRPFQIGYLFLGSSMGLAFYWSARLVFLFIITYDFFRLITKDSRFLSVAGATLITFSPMIQWWFSVNCYVELIIAVEMSVLLFDKYLTAQSLRTQFLCVCGIMICAGMYIFSMYLPVMIPLAYVLLGLIIWVIIKNAKKFHFSLKTFVVTVIPVVLFAAIILRTICISWDTILAVLNTDYPGKRMYEGGSEPIYVFFDSIYNIILPISDALTYGGNSCESARFIDLCPLGYILALIIIFGKKEKLNLLSKILIPINIVFSLVLLFPFPAFLMTITFLSKAFSRILFVVGFANILIVFSCMAQLINMKKKIHLSWAIGISVLVGILVAFLKYREMGSIGEVSLFQTLLIILISLLFIVVVGLLFYALHSKRGRKIFSSVLLVCILGGSLFVNPVHVGIDEVRNQGLSKTVQEISNNTTSDKWIVLGNWINADFFIANGASVINSVNTYPDITTWSKLDNNGNDKFVYNRYAHISVDLCDKNTDKKKFELIQSDHFKINITKEDLRTLNIKYVVSPKENSKEILSDLNFQLIYSGNQFDIFRMD